MRISPLAWRVNAQGAQELAAAAARAACSSSRSAAARAARSGCCSDSAGVDRTDGDSVECSAASMDEMMVALSDKSLASTMVVPSAEHLVEVMVGLRAGDSAHSLDDSLAAEMVQKWAVYSVEQ